MAGSSQHVFRQSRPGADADHVGVADHLQELTFCQGLGIRLDARVAVRAERLDSALVDAFEQYDLDRFLGERQFCHARSVVGCRQRVVRTRDGNHAAAAARTRQLCGDASGASNRLLFALRRTCARAAGRRPPCVAQRPARGVSRGADVAGTLHPPPLLHWCCKCGWSPYDTQRHRSGGGPQKEM